MKKVPAEVAVFKRREREFVQLSPLEVSEGVYHLGTVADVLADKRSIQLRLKINAPLVQVFGVTPRMDIDTASVLPIGDDVFATFITLSMSDQLLEKGYGMQLVTKHPSNHVKVVQVMPEDKDVFFRLWEVGIISQFNHATGDVQLFLTEQLDYESPVFRSDGNFILPDYEGWKRWPQLQEHIGWILEGFIDQMQELSAEQVEKKLRAKLAKLAISPKLKAGQAQVLWYNLAQGWGMAMLADGRTAARVHWSQVETEGFRGLVAGQVISYGRAENPTNTYEKYRKSSLQVDLHEVHVA